MAKRVNNISYKGIRHTPSLVSDADGYASECANLSPDGSDLKPMPMPVMKNGYTVTFGARLVFVHQGVGYENYVELDTDGKRLYLRDEEGNHLYYADPNGYNPWWWNEGEEPAGDVIAVEAMGDTLIVSTTKGTEYLVYQPDNALYKWIGQRPPMPVIEFRMHEEEYYKEYGFISKDGELISFDQSGAEYRYSIADDTYITDTIKGSIATLEKRIREDGRFYQPFFVRYALRMKTGDYILHSPVVLMLPTTDKCSLSTAIAIDQLHMLLGISKTTTYASSLQFKNHIAVNYSDWKDVISSIDVFVTEPIYNYNTSEINGNTRADTNGDYYYVLANTPQDRGRRFVDGRIKNYTSPVDPFTKYYTIRGVDQNVFAKKIESASVFHLVASIDINEVAQATDYATLKIDNLINLETLPTLEDDFGNSHCAVSPSLMQVYNSRLNMANITQRVFNGFLNAYQPQFNGGIGDGNISYITINKAFYRIKKNGKTFTVTYQSGEGEKLDYTSYLYYPDPDCYEAVLEVFYNNTLHYYTIPMKRHEYLNGSFFYHGAKSLEEYLVETLVPEITAPTLTGMLWYDIPNRFMMSSVGNPWHFPVANQFDIGRREIRALSINAENMDAPQFGQNPIYVFSADGIWTIAINADGTFNKLSYVSGDVLSEKWTIGSSPTTSAQQTTFFKTSRGIMAVIGSQVKDIGLPMKGRVFNPMRKLLPAVSVIDGIPTIGTDSYWLDVINGVCDDIPFADFAASCKLLYDYRNDRLLLYPGSDKIHYLYVYDLARDFWSKMLPLVINEGPTSPTKDEYNQRDNSKTYTSFVGVATIGAKAVLQDSQGHIWYVGEQPDENNIQVRQFGFYVSRPMRFGTDDMKTLTRVVHDQQISSSYEERVAMTLYGSRDGNNYYKISTLKGTSYKFFIVVLYTHIYPSSRYAYTAFEWEPRMTDKIR
jgi:hypothetical protein